MPNENVTNRVRRLRFDSGEMTQQQLAGRVGVTRQTIIAIEAGKYLPSLPLAFRIARTFGLPIEKVFRYEDDSPNALHEILKTEP
ncbi:MAG: helix-turn-helix transcriptional regulator [Sedimentisphaerales bacterium]|nr:helix-turn-helix transcriptional regulator [Sedimentisphaerales bacterium]